MKTIFKSNALQDNYEKNGFVIIPLLSEPEITKLKQLYLSTFGSEVKGLYTTHSHSNGKLNMQLHNTIGEIMLESIEKKFHDFDFVVNHFVVKSNVNSEEFRLHQDWNIVDEETTQAAHIWCPLTDTSETNGGMFVIKGSHRFFNNLRSGSLGIAFINSTPLVKAHVTPLRVKAGEALIYKQAIFHGSFPNDSSEPRIVVLSSIKEKDGLWVYYQKSRNYAFDKIVDTYSMNTETFLNQLYLYEKGVTPEGVPVVSSFVSNNPDTNKITDDVLLSSL